MKYQKRIDDIEKKGSEHDEKIILIFKYIKQFEKTKQQELEQRNRKPIGYKCKEKK